MLDLQIDERIFQGGELSFRLPAADQKVQSLQVDAMLEFEHDIYYITELSQERDDELADWEVTAELAWMRLADLRRPGTFQCVARNPSEGLGDILVGTGWFRGTVWGDATTRSFDASDGSVLDLIWQWAKVCGLEVSFDTRNRWVNFLPIIGADTGTSFRYGKNVRQIKQTTTPPQATRIYVYGRNALNVTSLNGGKEYIEDYSYYTDRGMMLDEAEYSYRKDIIYSDDTFTDAQALYDAGVKRLAGLSQPQVQYSCSVLDLSQITGLPEDQFEVGDIVTVADEVLGIDVRARVSRRVRHPYEPSKDTIELSFGAILLPDTNISSARGDSTRSWELFVSRNTTTLRKVRNFSTIIHRVQLKTIDNAEWAVNYKLHGVGVGTGNVTLTFTDDTTGLPFTPERTFAISDGVDLDFAFTFAEKEIPSKVTVMSIRARSDTAGVGIDIAPTDTAFWILARGTTRENPTLPNSIRYDFTGGLQEFQVPDDVSEILVEAHGSGMSSIGPWPNASAAGSMVKGTFIVLAGDVYTVEVGGPKYPNAYIGQSEYGGIGADGRGSTQMYPQAGSFVDSLLVAPGGGANANGYFSGSYYYYGPGGDSGFYVGHQGYFGSANVSPWLGDPTTGGIVSVGGTGATQNAPGLGGDGTGTYPAGDGAFNHGGLGGAGGSLGIAGGQGGGGWYGGGGGRGRFTGCEGGGGGSGWFDFAAGYDFENEDANNHGNGWLIVSWKTPDGE